MYIAFTDGAKGAAQIDPDNHNGRSLIITRETEVIACIKADHVTDEVLIAWGVHPESIRDMYLEMTRDGEW